MTGAFLAFLLIGQCQPGTCAQPTVPNYGLFIAPMALPSPVPSGQYAAPPVPVGYARGHGRTIFKMKSRYKCKG